MKKAVFLLVFFLLSNIATPPVQKTAAKDESNKKKPVRAVVIGGMTMTGMWDEISRMFEARTGIQVLVVATGPRPEIEIPFKQGAADILTMHSGDITTDLVADGYGIEMKPWTHNNIVIIGPKSDPAGIKGMKDGAEALKRIAKTGSGFVDLWGIGMREVSQKMWKKAGIFPPMGDWVIKDERKNKQEILTYVSEKNAYTLFGRMPVLFKKRKSKGLEIMVENDPDMNRPYIVMLANPEVFPRVNIEGARKLQAFLVSKEVQEFLSGYGVEKFGGIPLFYSLRKKAYREIR